MTSASSAAASSGGCSALAGYPARARASASSTRRRTRRRREVGELLVGGLRRPRRRSTALADGVDVVTYEFENVPVGAGRDSRVGAGHPAAAALEAAQDRLVEKQLFRRLGIPTAVRASTTSRSTRVAVGFRRS